MMFGLTISRVLLASLLLVSACLACEDTYVAKVTLFDGNCLSRPKFVDYLCDKNNYGEGNAQTHQNVAQLYHALSANFETRDPSVGATLNTWGSAGMSKRNRNNHNNPEGPVQHTELSPAPFNCIQLAPGSATGFNVRYHW